MKRLTLFFILTLNCWLVTYSIMLFGITLTWSVRKLYTQRQVDYSLIDTSYKACRVPWRIIRTSAPWLPKRSLNQLLEGLNTWADRKRYIFYTSHEFQPHTIEVPEVGALLIIINCIVNRLSKKDLWGTPKLYCTMNRLGWIIGDKPVGGGGKGKPCREPRNFLNQPCLQL